MLLWIFFEPARQCQVVIASVFEASVFEASVFEASDFRISGFETSVLDASDLRISGFETRVFAIEGVGSTDTTGIRTTKSGGGSLSAFASGSASGSAAFAAVAGGANSGTARASMLVLAIRRTAITTRPIEPKPTSRNTDQDRVVVNVQNQLFYPKQGV